MEEETWPPFRPVGYFARSRSGRCYCPDQPDPRLAVTQLKLQVGPPILSQNVDMADQDEVLTLIIGQIGGQVSVWSSNKDGLMMTIEPDLATIVTDLIPKGDEAKYIWKDLPALKVIFFLFYSKNCN